MTAHHSIKRDVVLQRARGMLNISVVRGSDDQSRLKDLRQQGSYRAVFPRPIQGTLEAVIINTAGGITGGDEFAVAIAANDHAKISVTTQAAERIYRTPDFELGSMQTSLCTKPNSQLYWLPQETILFEGSQLCRRLEAEVAEDSKFLMVEPLIFGRKASGETLKSCYLDDSVCITTGGKPIYVDRIKLSGDIASVLKRPAVANGGSAMASIVLVDPTAKATLDGVNALLPSSAGASLLADNILVVRLVCADSFALRNALLPVLKHLTHNAVPKNWSL
ncbi:urease accessory protein UreD [Paracoccaceae bacterium]|nr:urease accessory protein UreD [Paracoccaceae bacterium]